MMRQFTLSLILLTALAGCTQQQVRDGWGFPTGTDPQAAEPLQSSDSFESRLQGIQERLHGESPVYQSGEDQPASVAAADKSIGKSDLGSLTPAKVALIVPMSGSQSVLGQSMMVAGQMAMKDLGAKDFELLPRDSGITPQSAEDAVHQSIKAGAKLILGPVFAEQVRGARTAASNAGVPMVSFTTDGSVADHNTFVMGFLPGQQVTAVLEYAIKRGARKVLIVAPSTAYGQSVADTASGNSKLPATLLKTAPTDTSDSIAAKIAAQLSPQTAILFASDGKATDALIQALEKKGIAPETTMMLGTGLLDDPQLATAKALENVYFASAPVSLRSSFQTKYKRVSGQNPERLASLAYDAVALAVVTARDNGGGTTSFPPEALRDRNGFVGVDGVFRFTNTGLVERKLSILTWKSGTLTEMQPAAKSF